MQKSILSLLILLALSVNLCAQLNSVNVPAFYSEDTVPRIDIYINPDSLSALIDDISTNHEYKAVFVYNNMSIGNQ